MKLFVLIVLGVAMAAGLLLITAETWARPAPVVASTNITSMSQLQSLIARLLALIEELKARLATLQPQNQNVVITGGNCRCPENVNWVCGADGKTYSNSCLALCSKTTVASSGKCGAPSDSTYLVCGQLVTNICVAGSAAALPGEIRVQICSNGGAVYKKADGSLYHGFNTCR